MSFSCLSRFTLKRKQERSARLAGRHAAASFSISPHFEIEKEGSGGARIWRNARTGKPDGRPDLAAC